MLRRGLIEIPIFHTPDICKNGFAYMTLEQSMVHVAAPVQLSSENFMRAFQLPAVAVTRLMPTACSSSEWVHANKPSREIQLTTAVRAYTQPHPLASG
jgi:hypothetical protein